MWSNLICTTTGGNSYVLLIGGYLSE